MKRLLTVLLLLPVLAFALPADLVVGPQVKTNGSTTTARGETEAQAAVSAVSGDFGVAAKTGQLYTITTAAVGTSFTTAGASPLAAAGIAWLAVFNPSTSKVNLEIETVTINTVSGTPGVGGTAYNLGCNQPITAAQNATPTNVFDLSGGVAKGYTQTALTGSTLLTLLAPTPHEPFAAAIAATTPGLNTVDNVNGRYIVQPGCVFAVQAIAVGTAWVANGSIQYRQAVP